MKTAGVIWGHDFLGCDITLKLLSENYRVKVLIPEFSRYEKLVINTGLKAGENLLFCRINMENKFQLEVFLKDCDCLIHCGMPYKLEIQSGEGILYIPVVSNTGSLFKSLKNVDAMGKIIFFTSSAVYNQFDTGNSSELINKEKTMPVSKGRLPERAFHHSRRLIDKMLNEFSDNQIEIIVVSPVIVLNNTLINNREATLAGLRYMFTKKIESDRIFQRLVRQKLVNTMVNVNELPDMVFDSLKNYNVSPKERHYYENV